MGLISGNVVFRMIFRIWLKPEMHNFHSSTHPICQFECITPVFDVYGTFVCDVHVTSVFDVYVTPVFDIHVTSLNSQTVVTLIPLGSKWRYT